MIRFWYWFEGAQYNRRGGPWWSRDFNDPELAVEYFGIMRPLLHAWALEENPGPKAGDYPPKYLIEYNTKGKTA